MSKNFAEEMPCWNGRSVGLRTHQRLFICLIVITALICVILEVFYTPQPWKPPAHTLHHVYITADDSDGRRLGNVLFCYAAMLGIALQNNMTPVMPAKSVLVDVFQIKTMLSQDIENTLGAYRIHEEYGRRGSAYDYTTRKLRRQNTKLLGYYQSWRYLENVGEEVRRNLEFKESIMQTATKFFAKHQPTVFQNFVRVGIHVRRGDMLQPYYQRYGYVVADKQYFINAMEYFSRQFSNIQFVVCSDDISWCKENIQGPNVIYSEDHSDKEDMAILTLCNHTVVSVGSFGWWAAYLTNGITVYYDKWPREYSMLEYNVDKKAYFPPHWIPMH